MWQNPLTFLLVQCNLPFFRTPSTSQQNLIVAAVWMAKGPKLWIPTRVLSRFNPVRLSHTDKNFLICLNLVQTTICPAHLNKPASKINEDIIHNLAPTTGPLGNVPSESWSLEIAGHSLGQQSSLECPLYPGPGWMLLIQRKIRLSPCLESSWSFTYSR